MSLRRWQTLIAARIVKTVRCTARRGTAAPIASAVAFMPPVVEAPGAASRSPTGSAHPGHESNGARSPGTPARSPRASPRGRAARYGDPGPSAHAGHEVRLGESRRVDLRSEAEDGMGARSGDPSSFSVEINATGVPK